MIELKNISHNYGGKEVLNNLSINFEKEKLTSILGSSGSGKTTILRLIAGLEIPHKGEILIHNKTVSANGKLITAPDKRNVGFVFQDLALWPHFTVYQNVTFAPKERNYENIENSVKDIINFLGINELADKYPHQLSGGQKQLAAIARALALKPNILLMDEPFANLDVKIKRRIISLLIKIKTEFNLTIIYVTHDHKESFSLADYVCLINKGKIEEYGTVEEIKQSKNEYVKYFLEY